MPEPATHHISGLHSRGYLPHLKSEGKSYFVTFRIAGTLPKNILLEFKKEREAIVQKANATRRSLTRAEQQELFYWYSARVDAYLDTSNINCWLKNHAIAKLVHDALLHFNGQRYLLHAWVIMSNHVHVVVRPAENHNLSKILHTWKSYTANKANLILGRQGRPFWQRECYDHLIRDPEDLHHCIKYTQNNPVTARLCTSPSDYPWSSARHL